MTADERREAILTAARREFSRSGFHGASTARIAKAAGCSEPMLYKHFTSKQSLFAATLAHVNCVMGDTIDQVLEAPGDPLASWAAYLPTAMHSELYAEMVGLRKLAVTVAGDDLVRVELQAADDRLRARVATAIARGKELGTVHADVDPEYVAWMWLGIILAGSYRQTIEGPGGFAAMLPWGRQFIASLRTT